MNESKLPKSSIRPALGSELLTGVRATRRKVSKQIFASAFGLCLPPIVAAQSYPDKPIKILVPAPVGTVYDIYARRYAPQLSLSLGQPVIVDNKPGAGGNIAMEQLVSAPSDGHTLGIALAAELGVLRTLGHPYVDAEKLLTLIALLVEGASTVLVHAGLGVKNFSELADYLKRQGKPANLGIGPLYGTGHVLADKLSKALGHTFNLVPYKTPGAALPDLAGGALSVGTATVSESAALVQGGKVVAVAFTSPVIKCLAQSISAMSVAQNLFIFQRKRGMTTSLRGRAFEDIASL